MGFLRHFTPELLSIKKSATFAHSTFRIIIPSVGFIPSLVAPQQSQCPFIPTNKSTENFYDTVRFTLPLQTFVGYPKTLVSGSKTLANDMKTFVSDPPEASGVFYTS